MVDQFKTLAQVVALNTATAVYVVPVSRQTVVRQIVVANTSGAGVTIKLWVNGTNNVNVILPETEVLAGGHGNFNGAITLAAGESIYAQADSVGAITVSVFGLEGSGA